MRSCSGRWCRPALAHRGALDELRAAPAPAPSGARTVVADHDQVPALDHPYWWAAFTHYGSPW
jgi:CHAT domain-containing protein